jgi:hypothetical protein
MSESSIADEPSNEPQLPPRRWNRRRIAWLASVAVRQGEVFAEGIDLIEENP